MIVINSYLHYLRIITTTAADIHYQVSGENKSISYSTPLSESGVITSATTTSVCSGSGGSAGALRRDISFISAYNAHATDSNVVSIVYYNATNNITLYKATLLAGERLEYSV